MLAPQFSRNEPPYREPGATRNSGRQVTRQASGYGVASANRDFEDVRFQSKPDVRSMRCHSAELLDPPVERRGDHMHGALVMIEEEYPHLAAVASFRREAE